MRASPSEVRAAYTIDQGLIVRDTYTYPAHIPILGQKEIKMIRAAHFDEILKQS